MRNLLRRYGLAAALVLGAFLASPNHPAVASEKQVEEYLQGFWEMALWRDGRYAVWARKWMEPIKVRIVGPMSGSYTELVLDRLRAMAQLAGLEVTVLKPDDKGENFLVEFLDTTQLSAAGRSAGCVATTQYGGPFNRARLQLNLRMGFELRGCITHELMHAMGFSGHPHAIDSVLSYVHKRDNITAIDRMALRVLYDPRMKHGTFQLPAMALAREIIVDKMIDDGAPEATREMGHAYLRKLLPLTIDLAEKGNVDLQHQLGIAYRDGQTVEKDDKRAVEWLTRAATGAAKGEWMPLRDDLYVALGFALMNGRGAPANPAEAVRLYKLAANLGHSTAFNNLGIAYRDGKGVEKDPVEAYKWLAIAAGRKHRLATTNIEKLEPQLLPAQIEEGKRRAASWKPAQ